jgi:hypothetical protein
MKFRRSFIVVQEKSLEQKSVQQVMKVQAERRFIGHHQTIVGASRKSETALANAVFVGQFQEAGFVTFIGASKIVMLPKLCEEASEEPKNEVIAGLHQRTR